MRGCTVSHAAFELHKAAASGAITLTSESPKVPPANKTKLYLARSVNKQQQSQPAVRFFLIISVFNPPFFFVFGPTTTHISKLCSPVRFGATGDFPVAARSHCGRAGGQRACRFVRITLCGF
jgi:hypothetical protein